MRVYLSIILLLNFITVFGQNEIIFKEPLKIEAMVKVNSELKKGTTLSATGVSYSYNDGSPFLEIIAKNNVGDLIRFEAKNIYTFYFTDIDNTEKVWSKNLLLNMTYFNLLTNGMQYDLRNELNNEAIEYINTLNKYNQFFDDEYFEDYMYTLVNKIHNGILKDERPGNIYIKILKDPAPNAFALTNGCIVVTTGLLSTIQSEDELVGVLAHEVAHFALDHQIMNYSKELDRKKKAEFWSTFATVVAASADVYLTLNNENHIPGVLTASTAIVSSILSEEITTRLGIKFNHEQEIQADQVAKEILGVLKYDKLGLSAALTRIKNYCVSTGNFLALSGSGTHPNIDSRINSLGIVSNFEPFLQKSFLKKVSLVNSYNAWLELWQYAHHSAAIDLANRNIFAGVATETDYIVKAVVQRRSTNNKESNEEIINLLNKAKTISITSNIIIYKEEGITLIRLERKAEAKKAFQTYLALLNELIAKNESNVQNKELENEIVWTKKMIFKVDSL